MTLIVGAVLLLAGILGLALGKKKPAIAAAYPSGPADQAPPGYPGQQYPPQDQPGQGYPPQPYGQGYPPEQPVDIRRKDPDPAIRSSLGSTRPGQVSSTRLSPGHLRSTRPPRVSSTLRKGHRRPRSRIARSRSAPGISEAKLAWSGRRATCLDLIRLGVSDRIVRLLRRGRRDLLRNCVADRTVRLHRSARLNTRS